MSLSVVPEEGRAQARMSRLNDYVQLERNRRERIGVAAWGVAWALIFVGVAVLLFDLWGMLTFAFTQEQQIGESGWYQGTSLPAWLFVGGVASWAIGHSIRHPDDPKCPRCGHLFVSAEALSDHLKNDHADGLLPASKG